MPESPESDEARQRSRCPGKPTCRTPDLRRCTHHHSHHRLSIMEPVFGTPHAHRGIRPTGGIRDRRRRPNIRCNGLLLMLARRSTAAGIQRSPSTPRKGDDAAEEQQGSIEKPNDGFAHRPFRASPRRSLRSRRLPLGLSSSRLVIHRLPSCCAHSLSSRPLVSPTPSTPRSPIYGSEVTKVIGMLLRIMMTISAMLLLPKRPHPSFL